MKSLSLIFIFLTSLLIGCTNTLDSVNTSSNNTYVCFEVDAATLLTMISATTSVRGVKLPDGSIVTHEQLIEILQSCFGTGPDPMVAALLEALQAQE